MMVNWAQKGPIGNVQGVPKKLQIIKIIPKLSAVGPNQLKCHMMMFELYFAARES